MKATSRSQFTNCLARIKQWKWDLNIDLHKKKYLPCLFFTVRAFCLICDNSILDANILMYLYVYLYSYLVYTIMSNCPWPNLGEWDYDGTLVVSYKRHLLVVSIDFTFSFFSFFLLFLDLISNRFSFLCSCNLCTYFSASRM